MQATFKTNITIHRHIQPEGTSISNWFPEGVVLQELDANLDQIAIRAIQIDIKNMRNIICLISFSLSLLGIALGASDSIPSKHHAIVESWLTKNGSYRLATMEDCDCFENVQEIRNGDIGAFKRNPAYIPYYASGKFPEGYNFAILVISKRDPFSAKIVIFSETDSVQPGMIDFPFKDEPSLVSIGLFVKKHRGAADELYIGVFNSEAERLKIPSPRK